MKTRGENAKNEVKSPRNAVFSVESSRVRQERRGKRKTRRKIRRKVGSQSQSFMSELKLRPPEKETAECRAEGGMGYEGKRKTRREIRPDQEVGTQKARRKGEDHRRYFMSRLKPRPAKKPHVRPRKERATGT
jgi:hypothetical protein